MRLIDADALKDYIDMQEGRPFIGCTVGQALKIMTDEQPTIQSEPVWTQTEKDGELKAGDEVMWKDLEVNDSRGLALWVGNMVINGHRKCCIMCIDGSAGTWDTDEFTKTGRHFDINKILEAMRT